MISLFTILLYFLIFTSSFQPTPHYQSHLLELHPFNYFVRLYLNDNANNNNSNIKNLNNFNNNFHIKRLPDTPKKPNDIIDREEQQLINKEIDTLLQNIDEFNVTPSFQNTNEQHFEQHQSGNRKDTIGIDNKLLKVSRNTSIMGVLSFLLILNYMFKLVIMGIRIGFKVGLVWFGVITVKKLAESLGGCDQEKEKK